MHLHHTNPAGPIRLSPTHSPLPPIQLLQPHPAHPPTRFTLLRRRRRSCRSRVLGDAAAARALRRVRRGRRVYILAVNVLCFGDEGAAAVAVARVALLEAPDLEFVV